MLGRCKNKRGEKNDREWEESEEARYDGILFKLKVCSYEINEV
jgi:hypothetical protein